MKYILDCEFNGFKGELISMALIREGGDLKSLYFVLPYHRRTHPWVVQNVIPILDSVPEAITIHHPASKSEAQGLMAEYFKGDPDPVIVTDWPDDIAYFCGMLITAPGRMISLPKVSFEMRRVDAYPTLLADAVQHNAWWDALALRQKLLEEKI